MVNAISREKPREIISQEFPQLEDYTDLLYEVPGKTVVKKGDGTWEGIPVEEGFTQGCPLSPVFAGMVLRHLTSKIHIHLLQEVIARIRKKLKMDDERGAVPIAMGYVDNVNALITVKDAAEYLRLFEEIGGQLGAILNTKKTRFLTSTSGTCLVEQMINSNNSDTQTRSQLLRKIIEKYSTHKEESMSPQA